VEVGKKRREEGTEVCLLAGAMEIILSDKKNRFVAGTVEKRDLNQYWYSPHTIAVMVQEIEEHATKVAFLSTPSLWFSLKESELKQRSFFFDTVDLILTLL
jgi:hypothetical protein